MDFVYPYYQVQFTKDGSVFASSEVDGLMNALIAPADAPTDLFLMSHGWNNNIEDATALYCRLAGVIKPQIDAISALKDRRFAICGVLWPSKKFDDKDLIPSGAASLDESVTIDDLKQKVLDLGALYTAQDWASPDSALPAFAQLEAMMDSIEDDPDAQKQAVELLRGLLPQNAKSSEDASNIFFDLSPASLINKLSKGLNPPDIPAGVGAASLDPFSDGTMSGLGGATGFRDVLGGIRAGFMHLLNYTTYYLMKARAAVVGEDGVEPLIEKIRAARPDLRIYMIGHSFGCRLTAAAVNKLPDAAVSLPDVLLLLQGAFSHNGFAQRDDDDDVERGAFRDVIEKQKIRGPILVTHTRRDKAVGIAYPIASRINGVTAAALGDANDVFGGLGSNGTQTSKSTPEGVAGTLSAVGTAYPFAARVAPSTPYNLKADTYIGGHSDIVHPEVAFALATAIAYNT
jgi:predicted alpha/beta hydrolase family esterase